MFIPTIFENQSDGLLQADLYSRLLIDKVVLITGEIDQDLSVSVCTQLLYLSSHAKNEILYVYINSPGGEVNSGMAIYDTMRYVHNTIYTVCFGLAASMASILLTAGDKRYALPHSKIVLHQPLGGIQGQATDIAIHAKNILKTKKMITDLLVENTKITKNKMETLLERDFIITAEEAVRLGVIDEILEKQRVDDV